MANDQAQYFGFPDTGALLSMPCTFATVFNRLMILMASLLLGR